MRKAIRTVHRHGKPEYAVVRRLDGEIRRHQAVAVGYPHRGIDRLVGLRSAVRVVEDAVQLHRHRLRPHREADRAARRSRAHRRELIDDERILREVRMAGERDARSVAPNGADVLVARIAEDLRRVLVAGVRPAERRMDHVRDAGNNLRDRRTVRGKDLGRIDIHRAPVGCNLIEFSLELAVSRKDAIDGIDRSADGKRRPLAGTGRVVGECAGQQVHLLAVDCIDGTAIAGCGISAECRVDKKHGIAIPLQSHRTTMIGGITRKGR